MEIAQLKIVRAIHKAGSVSRASQELNRPPSFVSRHLAAFEKECGGRVFYRNGRGVELTELGVELLPQIELIIETSDRLIDSGKHFSKTVAGNVRLTVSPAVCEPFLSMLFSAVRAQYPMIRLQIFEGYSREVDQALEDGETDIAIFLYNGTSVGFHHTPVCQFETYVVALQDSATKLPEDMSLSDLNGIPLLLSSESSFSRRAISDLAARRGVQLNVAAEVNSTAAARALFNAGAGCLILAFCDGEISDAGDFGRDVRLGRLQAARLLDPDLRRTLVVATAPTTPSRVEAVRSVVVKVLQDVTRPAPQMVSAAGRRS